MKWTKLHLYAHRIILCYLWLSSTGTIDNDTALFCRAKVPRNTFYSRTGSLTSMCKMQKTQGGIHFKQASMTTERPFHSHWWDNSQQGGRMRPFTQLEGATLCLIDGSYAGWWHSLYSKHKCWPSQLASHRSPWWLPVFQFTTIKHAPPRAGAILWVPSVGITVGALVQRKNISTKICGRGGGCCSQKCWTYELREEYQSHRTRRWGATIIRSVISSRPSSLYDACHPKIIVVVGHFFLGHLYF